MKLKYKNGGVVKLQNAGTTIPLGGDYLEQLQNTPEVSGGSIQPSVKTEKLPEKFHGSQKAARTYAEGYQKGAKPVTKAINNAGQKIFNTTKNVAMFVPGPTGAITGLGQMGADTANGEYSKVAKDLGAAILIGAGLKGAQVGAKAAGRTLAGKGVNIPGLDAYDYSALRNEYFNNAANIVSRNTNIKSNSILNSTIDHLYTEYPELSSIGPKEAYRQYYETIFPASKVQIPYAHGTKSDLSGGLEASVKIPNAAAPETIGRNDFYLNLQPETSLQYADGIGVPEGFTGNKHRFWPLKEILGKPYESDAGMSKPIKLREQVPNRAGQFSRVKNADGTYSGHGKLLEEYKAELGMQDLSNEEFLQRLGVQNEESFNQGVAKNRQIFSDIYDSGNYHGLYHIKIDASKPLTINGGNTYYSERGIWNRMSKGGNDVLLHNNAANEFGSDVAVVRDVTPQKVRILGSKPDQQGFADFMGGKQRFFTEIPTSPQEAATTYHFDGRIPLSKPISEVERLGIPKVLRSNLKALEDPYYGGYQQGNDKYNAAVNSGNIQEAQRLRDLHFKIKAPDTKVVDKNGMPLHTYHGLLDHVSPEKAIKFNKYEGVNGDVEDAVEQGSKINHGKLAVPTRNIMTNYHSPNYDMVSRSYALGHKDLIYDDYLNIKNPFTYDRETIHNIVNNFKPGSSTKTLKIEPARYERRPLIGTDGKPIRDSKGHVIGSDPELIPERHYYHYDGVSDGAYFGESRKPLMQLGYDGLYIPQYYDSYGAFVSPAQFKSAEPITRTDIGEIIPIVKRDNFHNLDRRYKQGGIIKGQNGFLNTGQKAYNSKFGKGLRDFMFGKDRDLSDEEYLEKHGYNKPVGGIGILGALVAPEGEGLEIPEITAQHIGNQGKVLRGFESGNSKMLKVPVKETSKKASNWQKFLKLSQQEQDDFVRRGNGESFQGFATLKGNKQSLGKFRSGINSRK